MVKTTAVALARGSALFLLSIAGVLVAAVTISGLILTFMFGMIFLFPPAVRLTRGFTRLTRMLARRWSAVEIEEPYRPAPPEPAPLADGWYRHGRSLYKTPRVPRFNHRFQWLIKDPATWRDLGFVLVNPWSGGPLAAAAPLLVATGAGLLLGGVWWGAACVLAGVLAAPWLAPWGVRVHGAIAQAALGATERSRLASRVDHLAQARTEAVDSQAAELRRIERDLHDGAQARLVAVGMTIGAAEQLVDSEPAAAKALLAKAREASSAALQELRQLVRGIHPPVLAERGLGDAVRALALDSPLKTTVTVDLPNRSDMPLESAAYFAVSELLANAARHGGATEAWIDVSRQRKTLRITVTDDGNGGADPAAGTGLRGLERRLATFDGVLALNSPPGGPTTAVIELPHALTVPVTPFPRWRAFVMGMCWSLCWIPMFPQGFVAMALKLAHVPEKAWFLALYLPEPFQWPVIIGMIGLGLALLVVAIRLTVEYRRWEQSGGEP